MSVPQEISELIDRFDRNREAYHSSQYNETQLRREFIDPFFEALGWDVNNKQGYAESYKDVIHEDAIKIGSATKAPDYCFRIGGIRKFFVEAKKPSLNLRDDVSPAFQLRRYAWSAKLPLSVLTDFEEFVVYDCRIKPVNTDKASTARVFYLTYTEYTQRWNEIVSIFSRESLLKGLYDKYAQSSKVKKGTAEVDAAFLKEIESWRETLARNLALRNPGLTQHELNFAVQMTIDRIVFLRICEDRGIESYGRLMALQNGTQVYKRLFELFQRADERYNSGLFHFRHERERPELPDDMTPSLTIDDKPLKEIIKNLYYPDSPYEFSVLPADILGQVYEQFLGKVIRLTPGHRAIVEDKPEVKKAGGIYYTPTYIVQYIVKNTVGKLLEGKNPKQAAKLKILDPACGSGSFLINAYQYLLGWHQDWYIKDEPKKWATGRSTVLYQGYGGDWKLTTTERKRILLNNIYGVDIDSQAVEVTKLSLLLKVLEGENEETLNRQFKLFHERALPDLSRNIKCGNSLIGPDFYKDQQMNLLNEEEHYRINVFDWGAEFPEIMKSSGFDVVIGNPPYVRQEMLVELKEYFQQHYKVYHGVADLYVYFIERSLSLLKSEGQFGMIVASKWMKSNYGEPLRQWIKQHRIEEIIDFGALPVFKGATTYPCILLLSKNLPVANFSVTKVKTLKFVDLQEHISEFFYNVDIQSIDDGGWSLSGKSSYDLLESVRSKGVPLSEYVQGQIYYGIKTGQNEAFVIDVETKRKLISEDPRSAELIKPFLIGRDIKRYRTPMSNKFLIFTRRGVNIERYPAIKNHLLSYKDRLMPKPKDWKGVDWKGRKPGPYQWFEIQDAVDYYTEFEKPKILWPGISAEICAFAFDMSNYYSNDNTQVIISDDLYLLGILNSKVSRFLLENISDRVQGGFYRLKIIYVRQIPIPTIHLSGPKDRVGHDRMVELVNGMLLLHKQFSTAKTSHDKTSIQRQINATDQQIDQLVYELYGLTEEEIKIVEDGKQ